MPQKRLCCSAASGFTPMARRLMAILACALLVPAGSAAAPPGLPAAADLQRDGLAMARSGQPLVVLYSQNGCGWCEQARSYLVPMAAGSDAAALFRQVNLDADTPLTDFGGQRTTQRAFAAAQQVRFTPTVVVYGPRGERIGEAIVGMRLPDFYALYIEQAIAVAREQLKPQH